MEDTSSNHSRWYWVLLALLPGFIAIAMCVFAFFTMGSRHDALAALGFGMFYGSVLVPFIGLFYLVLLGRRYVTSVHGGYQSSTPFVLMYGAANFVLWIASLSLILANIKWV